MTETPSARAYWDGEADSFDRAPDHGLRDADTRAAWWELLDRLLPSPPARVADLGSGTGSLTVLLAEHGFGITGIDLSPRMIELAKAKNMKAGTPATFAVGDVQHPPLSPRSQDVVLARHILWALPDPGAALARWLGLLRGGGRLVMIEGRWATGGGLRAAEIEELFRPLAVDVAVEPLPNPALWGGPIEDERFAVIASA